MFLTVEDIDRQCPRDVDTNDTEAWQNYPFDDDCLRSFFHKLTAHLRRYYPWEEWIYTTLYVLISVLALVGNGVVILAVIRKREMRTARNVLIVNLALSNLMLALTTVPFLWLPSIDFDFPYSNFFCKFANALPGSNIYCSTLTISVMAIDRYYSVRSIKIKAPNKSGGQCLRAVLISALIWIFSLLLSFPLLIYYQVNMLYVFKDVYIFEPSSSLNEPNNAEKFTNPNSTFGQRTVLRRSYGWRQCRLTVGNVDDVETGAQEEGQQWWIVDERMIQLGMSLMQAIMLYAVPLVVISIFNVKLTRFLKMNAKQMSSRAKPTKGSVTEGNKLDRTESELLKQESLNSDDLEAQQQQGRRSTVGATSLAGLKSVAAGKQTATQRRHNRTTALLIAMAGAYAVLWFPFTFISVLIDLDLLGVESGSPIMERIDQTCKLVSILSICVNPFLYGFLNTNFRNEFNEIFTKCLHYAPAFGWLRQKQLDAVGIGRMSSKFGGTGKSHKGGPAEAYSAIVSTQDGMSVSTTAYRKSTAGGE